MIVKYLAQYEKKLEKRFHAAIISSPIVSEENQFSDTKRENKCQCFPFVCNSSLSILFRVLRRCVFAFFWVSCAPMECMTHLQVVLLITSPSETNKYSSKEVSQKTYQNWTKIPHKKSTEKKFSASLSAIENCIPCWRDFASSSVYVSLIKVFSFLFFSFAEMACGLLES